MEETERNDIRASIKISTLDVPILGRMMEEQLNSPGLTTWGIMWRPYRAYEDAHTLTNHLMA